MSKQSALYTKLARSTNSNDNLINIKVTAKQSGKKDIKFVICCSYSIDEKVRNIHAMIEQYLSKIHYPFNVKVVRVTAGFCWDLDKEWSVTARSIITTDMYVAVAFDKYKHKINSLSITCEHMNKLKSDDPLKCPIYYAMKQKYDYSSDNLLHLNSYIHFKNEYESKPSCKYGQDCKAYIRHETGKGGYRLDDECHIKIFKHPPRTRFIKLSQNIHSLTINKAYQENHKIYSRQYFVEKGYEFDKKDGFLKALIEEVVNNKFKYDLCLECDQDDECKHTDYSLLQIVDKKMKHIRHQRMASPLRRDHMLALILYTGCDCNYDLCGEQRKGNYNKWPLFDRLLYNAICLLSDRERGNFTVYSGLGGVKMNAKKIENGYFVTYVSTSWKKKVSKDFVGENEGMIIQIDKEYKNDDRIPCCDVSWISKFPDEYEVLFARTLHKNKRFSCVVLDDSNGIQTVSLKKGYND